MGKDKKRSKESKSKRAREQEREREREREGQGEGGREKERDSEERRGEKEVAVVGAPPFFRTRQPRVCRCVRVYARVYKQGCRYVRVGQVYNSECG